MIGLIRVLLRRVNREVEFFTWVAFMVDVSLNFSGILEFILLLLNLDLSHSLSPSPLSLVLSLLASTSHLLEAGIANMIFIQQV